MTGHVERFLYETAEIARTIDKAKIEQMAQELVALRKRKGRLWIIGLGGSAANASHATSDFRKLCGIDAQCPTDNVAEFSARANDEGWPYALSWQFLDDGDALLVLSVGGGTDEVSVPLVNCIKNAGGINMDVLAIVGKSDGYAATHAGCAIVIPAIEPSRITPHVEGWQSVILHCLVSHPDLQRRPTKW